MYERDGATYTTGGRGEKAPTFKLAWSAAFAAFGMLVANGRARGNSSINWADGSGNWSVPSNWNPAVIPGGGDAVTLVPGTYAVTLDVNPVIDSLTMGTGASLNASGDQSLTIDSTLSDNGILRLGAGGTLQVGGSATIAHHGSLFLRDSSTAGFANISNFGRVLVFNPTNTSTTLNVSGTFANNSGGEFEMTGLGDVANVKQLSNLGSAVIEGTFNVTGGGNGITDVPANSSLELLNGNFNVVNGGVTSNGLAYLSTVEGFISLLNNQMTTVTPAGGRLTVAPGAQVDVDDLSPVNVAGGVSNSGLFYTSTNSLNVSGTFVNNPGAVFEVGGPGGVASVNAFSNTGFALIQGTLQITGGGNGITDVPAGSTLAVSGAINLVNGRASSNGLAALTSVEGTFRLENGQTTAIAPAGGTLTVSPTAFVNVTDASGLTVNGGVNNSGSFNTGYLARSQPNVDNLSVSGTFANRAGASLTLYSHDTVSVQTLSNASYVNVNARALLTVGSGTKTIASGYQQWADGTLDESIGGSSSYGVINVTGAGALNGMLDITLTNGFVPAPGESFVFLSVTPGALSGMFGTISGDTFPGGHWQVNYDDPSGTATLTAVPDPAPASLVILVAPSLILRRRRT